jgi:alginate O-acetyltransferase complex protein AlgI
VLVFLLYWILGSQRRTSQNVLILIASYVFYGLWDWRFLLLLIASTLIDYYAGIYLARTDSLKLRKRILWSSLIWNLGILLIFKYFNFFTGSFLDLFGMNNDGFHIWNVIIPVGLSFYTFQTISYTIDVYKCRIPPTHHILEFACFVSFFPQLVAGPIERARHLLPQFEKQRKFDIKECKEGLRQILWGLFKKVIVAEKLGVAVDMVFNAPEEYSALTIAYGAVLFYFQIYCDFSGYTDIAIGTARLFGFKLSRNFNLPYLAKNVTDFWRRWHITLTRWFTDYVYVPLVKNWRPISQRVRITGLFVTMVLIGLWHGANWTFIVFGIFHGIFLALEQFLKKYNQRTRSYVKGTRILINIPYLLFLCIVSAVLFRATDMAQAWLMLEKIATLQIDGIVSTLIGYKLIYLVAMLLLEIVHHTKAHPLENLEIRLSRPLRWVVYYTLVFIIIRYAEPREAFISFQF